jgi:hypothetical protein
MTIVYINGVPEEFKGEWCDYFDRCFHRVDGPAVEYDDGDVEWWFNDKYYEFEDFIKAAGLTDEEAMLLALEWKC